MMENAPVSSWRRRLGPAHVMRVPILYLEELKRRSIQTSQVFLDVTDNVSCMIGRDICYIQMNNSVGYFPGL